MCAFRCSPTHFTKGIPKVNVLNFEFGIPMPGDARLLMVTGILPWGASQSMPIVAQLEEPRYMLMRQVLSEMTWSLRACLKCKLSRSSAWNTLQQPTVRTYPGLFFSIHSRRTYVWFKKCVSLKFSFTPTQVLWREIQEYVQGQQVEV